MFFDIGSLEFLVIIVLAILVFGPEKLPKMIQDAARLIRKVRDFSDNAKQDIRSELGPEFKDFEFEDLNPKRFAQKHLLDKDDTYGLKELRENLDIRKELTEVTDSVNGRAPRRALPADTSGKVELAKTGGTPVDLGKPGDAARVAQEAPPPFDADAT
ncbi:MULTISPECIES: sec-independent translocase [Streptomyces]|uniref:sec-independent translocase n=1 Tax=Streptomyces TaxID=1883 RepID=UPI001907DC7A|nr:MULTISPECIES: sec-independent translocase [unclassified Streptomyces]MCU4746856.1 sec-independent translocase [Streptomyces sp. G-5]QQN77554.1 Sec-independent protein translocase subunit TatB [Streptomyces sp. XC 2026]